MHFCPDEAAAIVATLAGWKLATQTIGLAFRIVLTYIYSSIRTMLLLLAILLALVVLISCFGMGEIEAVRYSRALFLGWIRGSESPGFRARHGALYRRRHLHRGRCSFYEQACPRDAGPCA